MARHILVLAAVAAAAFCIVVSSRGAPARATFPGANGKIVFTSDRDSYQSYDIYIMPPDGSSQLRLTTSPAKDTGPRWSPDGSKIVFGSSRAGNYDIFVMNADGGEQLQLTHNGSPHGCCIPKDYAPSWSPDGLRIAFVHNNVDIWTMNADGTNQARVGISGGGDGPDWSPDGTRLVYSGSIAGARRQIYSIGEDGSGEVNLSNSQGQDVSPRWSPDGSRVAFSSDRDGQEEIYVMNADGSQQVNITNNPAGDGGPVWSPDGTKIAFSRATYGNYDIYVMDTDGSHQTRLTSSAGYFEGASDWQPFFPRPGDVNCNRAIDSIDALLTLQLDAALVALLACDQNADVNHDGRIDAIDATLILQFDAGLLHSLPP